MSKQQYHAIDRVIAMALEPWAITEPMVGIVASILARRLAGADKALSNYDQRPVATPATVGGLAVIPIHGALAPRMNLLSDISGGATFEGATSALREAVADASVGTIILDWDSPGGSCAGATEFAHEILKARTKKPIISVANHSMCSAAYWTGACATEIVATPSAMVGSIGVYSIHEDLSKALDTLGVKLTYVSAGKFKVDGNETEPLSPSAHARMKAVVDAKYTQFVKDVAAGRGVDEKAIREGYGEGTVLTADEALALGMVNRIATLDDTIARVLSTATTRSIGARADASVPVEATSQEPSPATDQEPRRGPAHYQAELLSLAL